MPSTTLRSHLQAASAVTESNEVLAQADFLTGQLTADDTEIETGEELAITHLLTRLRFH